MVELVIVLTLVLLYLAPMPWVFRRAAWQHYSQREAAYLKQMRAYERKRAHAKEEREILGRLGAQWQSLCPEPRRPTPPDKVESFWAGAGACLGWPIFSLAEGAHKVVTKGDEWLTNTMSEMVKPPKHIAQEQKRQEIREKISKLENELGLLGDE